MASQQQWKVPQISYWHVGAPISLRPDSLPATAEVVVIGGGLMGSCTSYWLARAGVKVALLEQQSPAFGATGRNGGFHVVGTGESYAETIATFGHAAARSIFQLTIDSRTLLRQVLAEEQIACEYREPGRLNLALSEREYANYLPSIAAMAADGFQAERLDRAQVQELITTPLGPDIAGGLYAAEDGLLQPAQFVHGMQTAAQRHGATISLAVVQSLRQQGGDIQITTDQGTITAGACIVAVNAWSSRLIPELEGVIVPVRGQILNYAPLPVIFRCGAGAAVTPTGEYWHQTPEGAIVLGGCRAAAADGEVNLLAEGTTAEVQSALDNVFPQLFPQLEGLQVARRWSGPMAFTRDHNPIADRVPGLANAWFAGGFSGHGMPFGMRLGQLLAEAATTNSQPQAMAALEWARPSLQA
jgi:gamma-glutamylputrescine oxidase